MEVAFRLALQSNFTIMSHDFSVKVRCLAEFENRDGHLAICECSKYQTFALSGVEHLNLRENNSKVDFLKL